MTRTQLTPHQSQYYAWLLLRLPATTRGAGLFNNSGDAALLADMETRKITLLREINQRNLGYFEQEVRRTAANSPTLEEKLSWQKKQRELETKRSKLRRELFARQDQIESERNGLIEQLEGQLQQQVEEQRLFTIEWELR